MLKLKYAYIILSYIATNAWLSIPKHLAETGIAMHSPLDHSLYRVDEIIKEKRAFIEQKLEKCTCKYNK